MLFLPVKIDYKFSCCIQKTEQLYKKLSTFPLEDYQWKVVGDIAGGKYCRQCKGYSDDQVNFVAMSSVSHSLPQASSKSRREKKLPKNGKEEIYLTSSVCPEHFLWVYGAFSVTTDSNQRTVWTP
ncbi:transcription factor SOX-2 isoform X2 [Hemicordylus capensis]|uniref:transcription factor SOX-2 isoform X2 n=1 Tax=Hemicordylus capensis TaxID=884348 RepID=UPI002302B196|nr:transcription factor SOX-2 isoform X2 [Hemicordylus capensis]